MQTMQSVWKTVNVVICDDDDRCVQKIRDLLLGLETELELAMNIRCFGDGNTLMRQDLSQTDVLFLDIRLRELNGLDIALELAKNNPNYKLIIVSEVMTYAVQGYEVDTFRYIVKTDLEKAVPRYFAQAIRELGFFREKRVFKFVECGERALFTDAIVFVESSQQCCIFTVAAETKTLKIWKVPLNTVQEMLPADEFVRISRSMLVNVRYIRDVENAKAVLSDDTKLEVTAYRAKKIRDEIFIKKGRLKIGNA